MTLSLPPLPVCTTSHLVTSSEVTRTCTSLGDQSFTVGEPCFWNNLPVHLRDYGLTLLEYRRLLKMHLLYRGPQRLVIYR